MGKCKTLNNNVEYYLFRKLKQQITKFQNLLPCVAIMYFSVKCESNGIFAQLEY